MREICVKNGIYGRDRVFLVLQYDFFFVIVRRPKKVGTLAN